MQPENDRTNAEAQLWESEKRFRQLFENMMSGFALHEIICDNEGHPIDYRFLAVNSAFERLTGLTSETTVGSTVREVMPHIENFWIERYGRVAITGEPIEFEQFSEELDRHFLVTAYCPKPQQFACIFQDISELKLAEIELEKSKAFLDNVLNNIGDPVFVKDDQHRLIIVNDAFCSIFDRSRDEIIGKTLTEDVPSYEREHFLKIDKHVLATGEENSCEETLTPRGSQTLHLLTRKSRYVAENGDKYLVGVIRDISELKGHEVVLRQSEKRYKDLFENAPFPYQSLDGNGYLLEANSRWLEHLGYSRNEAIGRSFADFLHPEWQNHFRENFTQFKSIGEVLGVEFQLRKKDGTYVWVSFDGKISRDSAGNFIQTHCIFTDISEQKRLQDKVDKQNEALRQSDRLQSVGRLAGGIAHDFNNMLSIILGYTGLALEKLDSSDPLYGDMQEIFQAGKRSADLTRQLLAFARQQTVSPQVVNLNDIIGNTTNMLRQLIGEDVNFAWLPETELWSVKIDPSQIDQILTNLCTNAREAITGVGKITIETQNIAFDTDYCADHPGILPGEYIMLAVSDDGCGIEPEALSQIFEPFFTGKEDGHGAGLGLATVYGIVKQNNGFINVYSESGKGATFKVYLPRFIAQAVEVKNETVLEAPSGRGETVLLVEDDPSILKLGKRILSNLGYQVLSTTSTKEAQKLAGEFGGQIDLLLTDVVMPEMNGRELSEQIKRLYPQLKVLFMSGYTANVIAHRGVLDENVYFISKPFSQKDLALKVKEVLDSDS